MRSHKTKISTAARRSDLISLGDFCRTYDLRIEALRASIAAGYWTGENGLVERLGRRLIDRAVFERRYRIRRAVAASSAAP